VPERAPRIQGLHLIKQLLNVLRAMRSAEDDVQLLRRLRTMTVERFRTATVPVAPYVTN
jgi:hypothetical protein